jgi:Ni/Co efflux regulator RcnB
MKRIALTAVAATLALTSLAPGAYADNRNNNRWNDSQNNGYTYNGQWHYGRPSANVQNQRGFQAGYHQWRRGDRLPSEYRNRYRTVDYRSARLRAPPRGYHYVRDDRGNIILAGIATGVILSLILANH